MPVTQSINLSGAFPDTEQAARELQSPELRSHVGRVIADVIKDNFVRLDAERGHNYSPEHFYGEAARSTGYTEQYGYPAVVVMWIGVAMRYFGGLIKPKNAKYLSIPNSFSTAISSIYGTSPREIGNLRVVFGRQQDGSIGPIALAANDEGAVWQHHMLNQDRWGMVQGRGEGGRFKKGSLEKLADKWEATEEPQGKIRRPLSREEQGMAKNVGKKSMSTAGEILFWLKKYVYQDADASVLPSIERLTLAGREAMIAWLTPRTATSITVGGVQV